MSDHDAKVEAAAPRGEDLEQKHPHENALDIDAAVAISDGQNDGEHDEHGPHRRLSDPQGKLRGKSSETVIKSHGGGGGSSRPGGGPKNDESDNNKSPEGPDESQGGTTEPSAPSGDAEQPAPPKRKGKLRGKAAPAASKGGTKGTAGLPGGAKT